MTYTDEEKLALFDSATRFMFYPTGTDENSEDMDNLRNFTVEVRKTDTGKWMVWNASQQAWNPTTQTWYYYLLSELRTPPVKDQTEFELDEAIELAQQIRDTVRVNGLTYGEWLKIFNSATSK